MQRISLCEDHRWVQHREYNKLIQFYLYILILTISLKTSGAARDNINPTITPVMIATALLCKGNFFSYRYEETHRYMIRYRRAMII